VPTGSELLQLVPPAPLNATLVARPVRVCVLVPSVEGVPWERMVEHGLASQSRVWGGASNLVVPLGWEITDDELFWRVVACFDPDLIGLHMPTLADAEGIAPEKYRGAIEGITHQLEDLGFDEDARQHETERRLGAPYWGFRLSDSFQASFVERVGPLHLDEHPDDVFLNGTDAPPYPLRIAPCCVSCRRASSTYPRRSATSNNCS
jgi:hypothetical protein